MSRPVPAPPGLVRVDVPVLESGLRSAVEGEVRFDAGSRGAYSTDASNYRQIPLGVVVPRSIEAGASAIEVCHRYGAPVLSRGGGTSLAGQGTNAAVVIDWTKYCHHLLAVDPGARTCVVEPGMVLDDLNAELAAHGLEFGPRPSTHSHCALGGMIGNNSCGATAQRTGKTVDNVRRLEVLTYDGLRCWVGPTGDDEMARIIGEGGRRGQLYRDLRGIRDRYGDDVRHRFPDIPRRVSGYNIDALLPEAGFDVAKLVVGSEGTLATVLRAELDLVPVVEHTAMLVLGFPDIADAADAVPGVLEGVAPVRLEALDDRLVEFMRAKHLHLESIDALPAGRGWLIAQYGGESPDEALEAAYTTLRRLGRNDDDEHVRLTSAPVEQEQLLKARESGLGATARAPGISDTWPGWEDSAVPPDRLGDYLRDLRRLFAEFDLDRPSLYGHFGQACLHVRIPFRLDEATGVAAYRDFLERAADLVASYGGSLSGEHGDGQARGELLVRMFGSRIVQAFGEVKAAFDPDNRMNPGKVVAPFALDGDLRLGADWRPGSHRTQFGFPEDDHSFSRAALRCVGVGQCRRPDPRGGVMCPSYQVTREEEHSTRGRARLLFEMLEGHEDSPVRDGWRSTEVRDALDLCLACKGCKSDCPVGVDMATYKAEFLYQHYRGRVRPMAHYALGWLPALAKAAKVAPGMVNALLNAPGIAALGKRLAGVAPQRDAPAFAGETFQQWWTRERAHRQPGPGEANAAVLWPDTFVNHFAPHIGKAAVRVLESAGFRVAVPAGPVCCGLTWISTGQLPVAKKVLRHTLDVLRPWIEAGTLVVGLEPSCTAVFRSDAAELLPQNQDVHRLSKRFVTLAEALLHHAPEEWHPSPLRRDAIAQKHCHHHAIMGFSTDTTVLHRAGVDVEVLDSGCCGLAGNFGFERGHYDVSMACAERTLLPAVREAAPETLILADGFSCRTQIEQGNTGRVPLHLAEVLQDAVPGERPEPTRFPGERAGRTVTAAAGLVAASLLWRRLRP
ncbi:FAD-binding and (Fe-S)-binding domain-containing protein [Amycolatopsis decaplanina]|uniref:FAD-binding and (Fe-S)-binding domain-containing protein n=1 Tax=Amycolatopsis decaplanina TaxID=208441 RepID=UPI0006845DEA|nr:FAD-binding and (Fe-S)-binding domain-containing protein [Amycolatopsis decaplanina]